MDSSKIYTSLVMEIRPRLQSVNIYISLASSADGNCVSVRLNADNFEIVHGSLRHSVPCTGFHIVPNSLGCFSIDSSSVTFRFCTENVQQQLGTSRCEIVQTDEQPCENNNATTFLRSAVAYDLKCANCLHVFGQEILFERVLPLPESSDSDDWFCHVHGNEHRDLLPRIKDIFYSHCSVHLNAGLLSGFVKGSTNLVCNRCMAWIGTVLTTGVHKLWFNTIIFSDSNNNFNSSALDDVFKAIQQVSKNSLVTSTRIVISCQSSQLQQNFILLWILEKRLRVYFDLQQLTISDVDVSKVLFKFEENKNILVSRWLDDVNVSSIDVSKPMMVKLLEHLYDMNRYIPKDFSTSNNFYVSYLKLYG